MKPLYRSFLALMLTIACGCSDADSPLSSSESSLTGTLKGRVQFGSRDMADLPIPEGVATISVEGTTISTTTDSLGRWAIDSLPAGTYNLSFTREGFATRREIGFQFVGGGVAYLPYTFHLLKQTTLTISDLKAMVVDTSRLGDDIPTLYVTGMLNHPSTHELPKGLLVIGQHETLGINDRAGAHYHAVFTLTHESGGTGAFEQWIPLSMLKGFTPGATTRVLGYGWVPESSYYDPELGTEFSPNHSTPDTTTFVMP